MFAQVNLRSLTVFAILSTILCSCINIGAKDSQSTEHSIINGCILPSNTFAYSTDTHQNKEAGGNLIVLPPPPWKAIKELPKDTPSLTSRMLASRFINGSIEIWVSVNSYVYLLPEMKNENYGFNVYNLSSGEWKFISSEIDGSGVFVDKIFVTKDGSLWGQNVWHIDSEENFPLLSRYNEEKNIFEFEENTKSIPASRLDSKNLPYWSEVVLDKNDTFWIFVHKDAIYKYDPFTQEVQRQTGIPDILVGSLEPSIDDSIYFTNLFYIEHTPTNTINDVELFHYNTSNKNLEKVSIPLEPWPVFSNILIDHLGRLWLDNLGWREPDGNWYQIHRSPIFITNVLWSGLEHRWKTPQILLESSNNYLWFKSDNGMSWLDPTKGEWCWFTTEQSNIIEDQQHNLWMMADDKLYMYPINP